MTSVGCVFSLYYTPVDGYIKSDTLDLDTKGILEGKHYDKRIDRSILLVSLESYALLKEYMIAMPYGILGENILIDYNPYGLDEGSRLKIGNVILEITQLCTLCSSLSKIDSRVPKLLKNDRGIFAKVVEGGSIKEGDSIYLLD